MKILLIAGHGAGDTGALGNGYKEADLTRELVRLTAEALSMYECSVDVYNVARNAYKDITDGTFNLSGTYNYALEFHFNWFKEESAHGSEIFITSKEEGYSVEQGIMNKLKPYFTLRDSDGVKVKDFLVISVLKGKGISSALLETCFISNKKDMKEYQGNKEEIADAIAEGIAEGFKLKKKPRNLNNTHVVKFLASDSKTYYMNVYDADQLEKIDGDGYYNRVLTIGTVGERNLYPTWDKKKMAACGKSKGKLSKDTKVICKVVKRIK